MGELSCWGYNSCGQLGDGTWENRSVAVPIPLMGTAIQVVVGECHTCVLLADGTVQCWGDNDYGQLGDGSYTSAQRPVSVPLTGIVEIMAGGAYNCARNSANQVWCWGDNSKGQLAVNGDLWRPVVLAWP